VRPLHPLPLPRPEDFEVLSEFADYEEEVEEETTAKEEIAVEEELKEELKEEIPEHLTKYPFVIDNSFPEYQELQIPSDEIFFENNQCYIKSVFVDGYLPGRRATIDIAETKIWNQEKNLTKIRTILEDTSRTKKEKEQAYKHQIQVIERGSKTLKYIYQSLTSEEERDWLTQSFPINHPYFKNHFSYQVLLKQAEEYFLQADKTAKYGLQNTKKYVQRPTSTKRYFINPEHKTIQEIEKYLTRQRGKESGILVSEEGEGSEIDEGDLGAVELFQRLITKSNPQTHDTTTDRKLTEEEYLTEKGKARGHKEGVTDSTLKKAARLEDAEDLFHLDETGEREEISLSRSTVKKANKYNDLVHDSNYRAQEILQELEQTGWKRWDSITCPRTTTKTADLENHKLLVEYAQSLTPSDPDFDTFENHLYIALEHLVLIFFSHPRIQRGDIVHFRLCGDCKNLRKEYRDPKFIELARRLINFNRHEPHLVFLHFINFILHPAHRGKKRIYFLDLADYQAIYQEQPPRKIEWSPGIPEPDYHHLYEHLKIDFERNPACPTEEEVLIAQRRNQYLVQWFARATYKNFSDKNFLQLIKDIPSLQRAPDTRTEWLHKPDYTSRSISQAGSIRSRQSTHSRPSDQVIRRRTRSESPKKDFPRPLNLQELRNGPPSNRPSYYHSIIRVHTYQPTGRNIITDVLATSTLTRNEIANLPEDFGFALLRYTGNQRSPVRSEPSSRSTKRNRSPSPVSRDAYRRRN